MMLMPDISSQKAINLLAFEASDDYTIKNGDKFDARPIIVLHCNNKLCNITVRNKHPLSPVPPQIMIMAHMREIPSARFQGAALIKIETSQNIVESRCSVTA